ncbi:MAG: serine/threonine-protein kinase, partial [Chlamydiia bacterium]|nr:serine/threonine-protein kinase [Chlamydiia bacterium]
SFKRDEMGGSTLPTENFTRITAHPALPLAVLHFEKGAVALMDFSKLLLTAPSPSSMLSAAAAASPDSMPSRQPTFPQVQKQEMLYNAKTNTVYKAIYNECTVAFKVYRLAVNDQVLARAKAEESVWRNLNHTNVIKLIEVFQSERKFGLVLEYQPQNLSQFYEKRALTDSERKVITKDIASGLHYLHSQHPAILHRDIRGTNILITDEGHAKLTDFGMSRTLREGVEEYISESSTHSLPWQAPETYQNHHSEKTDVYALGMTIYEMTLCQAPFKGCNHIHDEVVNKRNLPSMPAGDVLEALFQSCCKYDPEERPTAQQILIPL